jgi:probable addiction module antidote protein
VNNKIDMNKISEFDMSDYLENSDDVLNYLSESKKYGVAEFVKSLGVVAKSKGMTELAKSTGLKRESLYKVFQAKGSPKFDTLEKILNSLGYKIAIQKL